MPAKKKITYQAPAVQKAFELLKRAAESQSEISLSDLARQLGFSRGLPGRTRPGAAPGVCRGRGGVPARRQGRGRCGGQPAGVASGDLGGRFRGRDGQERCSGNRRRDRARRGEAA